MTVGITPGEENLEDLADEFVRLETSNGVTLDEEDFKARADFWGRLIRIARANEHGVLLTPGGQEIFIIRPVPYLCRADVERTWPTELPNLQRKSPAKRPKGVGVKLWRVNCIVLDLRRGGHGTQSSLSCWKRSIRFSRSSRRVWRKSRQRVWQPSRVRSPGCATKTSSTTDRPLSQA